MIKLSDYIFSFLKEKGVEHIFMLPGGGAMHLNDSLGRSGIPYTCFLHEQGAAIAAESYAQHTNKPGVVSVTSGPGATNAITAVTAGYIDSTPMLILSGQCKRADIVGDRGVRQIGSQEVNIIPMVSPITKYAAEVLVPEEIKYHLERAWHEATSDRPGPCWLSVPLDVQAIMLDETALDGFNPEAHKSDISEQIETAAARTISYLIASEKPLLLAGNGIKLDRAEALLYQLVDLLGIPVQTTWKSLDLFGEDDPHYLGHPGIMGDRGANHIIQEADLLISVGSHLDTSITAFNDQHFAANAKKIIVDIDQNELNRMNMEKEIAIACPARDFLQALIHQAKAIGAIGDWSSWLGYGKELRAKYPVVTQEHKDATDFVSAYYFIDELCKDLTSEDIIVPESSGAAGEITYQAWKLKKGQKMKNAAGLGSMGFGLPYSVGACLANDCRRTILINGDGAFQLNIQELETVRRLKLPIKMFIWNNDGYASIRAAQRNHFEGRYVGCCADSGLTVPDSTKIAAAYGISVFRISNNQELDNTLSQVLESDGPVLCEIMISPDETCAPRVKAYMGKDGQMVSGLLEKMWPPADDDLN